MLVRANKASVINKKITKCDNEVIDVLIYFNFA